VGSNDLHGEFDGLDAINTAGKSHCFVAQAFDLAGTKAAGRIREVCVRKDLGFPEQNDYFTFSLAVEKDKPPLSNDLADALKFHFIVP
jgi:hypothetical protein